MEELNKKLAEWIGFKLVEKAHHADIWESPNGTRYEGLPHFTFSLDACFKWLVPKLGKIIIQLDNTAKLWYCSLVMEDMQSRMFTVRAETPALALCKAIEKLIAEGEGV